MYKKILVPLDGSLVAECVIPHIESVAQTGKSEVELITVVEPIDIPTRGKIALSADDMDQINENVRQETHRYLQSVIDRLKRSGIKANPVILTGKPADSLVEYIHNNDIDLVIMASHGRSGISKWFWGSIAEKVVRSVNVPVLLIKATACESGD